MPGVRNEFNCMLFRQGAFIIFWGEEVRKGMGMRVKSDLLGLNLSGDLQRLLPIFMHIQISCRDL